MEEDQNQGRPHPIPPPPSSGEAVPSSSSSAPSSHLYEQPETTTTTTTTTSEVQVQVQQPDDATAAADQHHQHRRRHHHRLHRNGRNVSLPDAQQPGTYRFNFTVADIAPADMRDDIWSCLAVLVTFWFFASMTLILGFYGSFSLQLGPNCSKLISVNQLFVQSIQAQETEGISGPMLYGFHTLPALDAETTWTESHNASVQSSSHKEWVYHLNTGSKVDISYDVKTSSSSPLSLVIAQGEESLIEWIEDPSYPNSTLSWNMIYGTGHIEQEIDSSANYYIAVGNMNSDTLEVQLNFTMTAVLYNTSEAYYRCSLYNKACSFSLMFFKKNYAILTSPGSQETTSDDSWYIRISYGPRWVTYILGSGVSTIIVLALFRFCNMLQPSHRVGSGGTSADNQDPLLSPKDDDLSSWGSSYDSVSNDEDDFEEWLPEEGKQPEEGENSTNPRKLCVICFDSPRDCFFLPCGHCAACFDCASRIAEEAGTCPICRRRMKKVRKIFSV